MNHHVNFDAKHPRHPGWPGTADYGVEEAEGLLECRAPNRRMCKPMTYAARSVELWESNEEIRKNVPRTRRCWDLVYLLLRLEGMQSYTKYLHANS